MDISQIVFEGVFLIACAVGVHLLLLRVRGDNIEIVHSGSMFNLVQLKRTTTHPDGSSESVVVPNARRSILYSALLMGGGLALGATIMAYLAQRVTGEHIGMFLVGTQTFSMLMLLAKRFAPNSSNKQLNRWALAALGIGTIVAFVWQAYDNWVVSDFAALLICIVVVQTMVQAIPIRYLVCGCLAIVLYDLWGVWGQQMGVVGGGAIAEGVTAMAKTRLPPMLIVTPYLPLTLDSRVSGALGIGDILLPAFVTLTAAAYKLHRWVIAAYVLGLIITGALAYVSPVGVPAMVPILPIMIVTMLLVAKIKKVAFV